MSGTTFKKKPPLNVKKSYKDGHISVGLVLKARDWNGSSINVTATTDLTIEQAREFASDLLTRADEEDAKVKAKEAKDQRRKQWQEREIAAGRMVILNGLR